MQTRSIFLALTLLLVVTSGLYSCKSEEYHRLNTVVELNIGDTKDVELINGETVQVSLLDMSIERDSLRGAIRAASVDVRVDGEVITIGSGNHTLPVTTGRVKIDCPAVKEFATSNYYRFD